MYNCWNEALEYLIKKYGEKLTPTGTNYQGQKNTTKMVRTYNSDKIADEDKNIVLLMGQYYLGISAKKELYYILESKGLIKETAEA